MHEIAKKKLEYAVQITSATHYGGTTDQTFWFFFKVRNKYNVLRDSKPERMERPICIRPT